MAHTFIKILFSRPYRCAGIFYSIPFVTFMFFILDSWTFECTGLLFWVFFLASTLPCALIGLVFSIVGYRRWKQISYAYKDNGIWLIIVGVVSIFIGLMGWLLLLFIGSV